MSVAEQTAYRLYESYQLGDLSYEVKRHLVHLIFSKGVQNANGMPLTAHEEHLRERALNAYIDAVEGKSCPSEEMEARIEAKYPWLCE